MENKVLKPKIRFKGFTDTWEQRKLDDIVDFYRGRGLSWNDITDDGKNECVLYGNLYTDYGMVISKIKYKTNVNKDSMVLSKFGDVLIPSSDTTPTGLARATSIDKSDVILGGDINVLRPKKDNGDFISYSINVKRTELIKRIKGTTVRHLNNSDIEDLEIRIAPNIDEQIKISKILTKIDNLITLHQSKYDKLVNVKKALLEKMFPKDGKNVPEIRFKGFTDTWEQRKLNELTNIITKGTTPLDKVNEGTINFIKIENIDSFSGNINITSKITEEEHNSYLKRSQLKENDLLFSIAGTLGRVTVVKSDVLPANTNQALAIIRLKDGDINYIKTYLKGKTISNFIKRNPTIGAQPNLSLEQVGNFDIDMPNKEEQRKLGNLFNSIDNLITLHQHKLEKLKNMKKSLLNKMFI